MGLTIEEVDVNVKVVDAIVESVLGSASGIGDTEEVVEVIVELVSVTIVVPGTREVEGITF